MLFRYLELTGIDDFSVTIAELEDVHPTVKVVEVDYRFGSYIVELEDFFTYEAENLEVIGFIVVFFVLKIEVDDRSCGVGIELDNLTCSIAFSIRRLLTPCRACYKQ